jgi:hypothetical protein
MLAQPHVMGQSCGYLKKFLSRNDFFTRPQRTHAKTIGISSQHLFGSNAGQKLKQIKHWRSSLPPKVSRNFLMASCCSGVPIWATI